MIRDVFGKKHNGKANKLNIESSWEKY